MNKAIFLDRDGTINIDYGYIDNSKKIELIPNAIQGLKMFVEMGYLLIIITNQSGVARGMFSIEVANGINDYLVEMLKKNDIIITDVFMCPHYPSGLNMNYVKHCECRKPGTLLVERAVSKYNIDVNHSFFIGDKDSDISCGKKTGCNTIKIKGQYKSQIEANYQAEDLLEAAKFVKNVLGGR